MRYSIKQTQKIPRIGIEVLVIWGSIGIDIENPKFPSIGIGIEKLIL